MIKNIIKTFKKEFKTLNRIEVSKNNILANFQYLSSLSKKVQVATVLKSDGYGHGIENIAKILDYSKIPFFCVDSLYEAYKLLKIKVQTPILITGYTNGENLRVKKLPFSYALYTLDLAKAINDYQPKAGVHIFIDTGMHREGIPVSELNSFLENLKKYSNIKIEGVMSHLASSEGKHDLLFLNQIKQFKMALSILRMHKIRPKWIHIGATGAIVNPETREIITKISNMVRAGLSLYGISSSSKDSNLKPSLKLVTHLTQIKKIKKGGRIGYDGTFVAKKDMLIGTLPIGYYDGVDRGLSNKGVFMINDKLCPILGRVSMNLTTIDLSNVKTPQINQQVTVYSDNPNDKNSIENVAKLCKKIPYEILVNLASSTKRIVV